jgi:hypothetical protein
LTLTLALLLAHAAEEVPTPASAARTPAAGPPPARLCAEIIDRTRDRALTAEEVAAGVRRDDRAYGPDVATCLCAFDVPPTVQREARRQILRTTAPTDGDVVVATGDPLTSADFQVSVFLGKQLDALDTPEQPFVLLPTRLQAPMWLDIHALSLRLRDFEVPGARLPEPSWWSSQGVRGLPRGPLAELLAEDVPATFRLTALRGTIDRVLWLDVAEQDGVTTLQWSLRDITGLPPYRELGGDVLTLRPSDAPLVGACEDLPRADRAAWRRKVGWPPGRVATVTAGVVLASVFGGLAIHEATRFQAAAPGDPGNRAIVTRNAVFGGLSLAGIGVGVVGVALPGPRWR